MRKVSLVLGLLFLFACLFVFASSLVMPRALFFLAPVFCPGGQIGTASEDVTDREGTRTSVTLVCRLPNGEEQDITVLGLALMGVLVLVGGILVVLSLPFSVVKPGEAGAAPGA